MALGHPSAANSAIWLVQLSEQSLRVAVKRGLWERQAAYDRYREMRNFSDPGMHFDSPRDL
jgi:hypothetical protein